MSQQNLQCVVSLGSRLTQEAVEGWQHTDSLKCPWNPYKPARLILCRYWQYIEWRCWNNFYLTFSGPIKNCDSDYLWWCTTKKTINICSSSAQYPGPNYQSKTPFSSKAFKHEPSFSAPFEWGQLSLPRSLLTDPRGCIDLLISKPDSRFGYFLRTL